jgi:hypothetical protein
MIAHGNCTTSVLTAGSAFTARCKAKSMFYLRIKTSVYIFKLKNMNSLEVFKLSPLAILVRG